MKIALSERQESVLIFLAISIALPPFEFSFLQGILFAIAFIILSAIVTKVINKRNLFKLWCLTPLIIILTGQGGALIQYAIIRRQDRGKWEPIDFIFIILGCIDSIQHIYNSIHTSMPWVIDTINYFYS